MVRALALAAGLVWAAGAGVAQDCQLALLLALDVSSSVDASEYQLQKEGLAAALLAPEVQRVILEGDGFVALAVYEWSGRRQSAMVLDWVSLRSEADILAASERVLAAGRSHTRFPTAMGYALGYGATLLARGPDCLRRVIDVSGDGVSNDGFGPALAYRHFPFEGVTVNGLAVLGADDEVAAYYRDRVRFGPGAFVETSTGYTGFREAMERKLFREINDMMVGALPGVEAPG